MSIYVEVRIRHGLDDVWKHTQNPELHERWDLRFSEIDYLPRSGDEPQRFRYETRLGFGLRIRGAGESTGSRNGSAGERTSALKFWSEDHKSLIREGSGYWQYVPTSDGIRFITWYDYGTRHGLAGRIIDGLLFRPLMGWATAWSFDRLRLWIEKGIDPETSMQRSLVHAIARLTLAIVFLYQGLVPKLLYRHSSELAILSDAGFSPGVGSGLLIGIGLAEIALAVVLLAAWRSRWPLTGIFILMPVAVAGLSISSPEVLTAAFNPVTLNLACAALAAAGWLTCTNDLPSASRCLRTRPLETTSVK